MGKPKWEKEMEEYVNRMTEDEVRDFLQETKYEFYKNVKTSFLGLKGLDPLDDPSVDLSRSLYSWPTISLSCKQLQEFVFDTNSIVVKWPSDLEIKNVLSDKSSTHFFTTWVTVKDINIYAWPTTYEVDFQGVLKAAASVAVCTDVKKLMEKDDTSQYDLAA